MGGASGPAAEFWPALVHRRPRAFVVVTLALMFTGAALIMHAESQIAVVALVAGFIAAFVMGDRSAIGRAVVAACGDHRRLADGLALLCAAAMVVVFHDKHYILLMLSTVALFSAACAALSFQLALGGLANFAGAAFFVCGSYTAAVLTAQTAMPRGLVALAGGVVSSAIGLVLLMPVLRTRGHYAALVTIAFSVLLRSLLEVNDALGGPQGMKIGGFAIFGLDFNRMTQVGSWAVSFYLPYAVLAIVVLAAAFAIFRRLECSWIGVALDAVRSDETVASVFGLSIARWKILAFVLGNAIIGVAGAVYGMMNGFVNPSGSGLGDSLLMLSIVVLGGAGNLWGAVVAAGVILVVPEKLHAIEEYRLLLFALLVLAILLFRPSGIMPRPIRDLSRYAKQQGAGR